MAQNIQEATASTEEKLKSLYALQLTDSKIDSIRVLRGELPLEVKDLEDELEGLATRIKKIEETIKEREQAIEVKRKDIVEAEEAIKKYSEQQMQVRNNREYESISKEIEFQNLEIELAQKRIKEYTADVEAKRKQIEFSQNNYDERKADLDQKKAELEDIIAENQKDEDALMAKSAELEKNIEPRLLNAYKRIRGNARNGLAVVTVERDACGGCFNKIPPQRQLDIQAHKKIIVCEYCGRILVDGNLLSDIE